MAKTKEQVNRYLTHCKFPPGDWSRILLYCRRSNYGRAHKSAHPKSESSFDDFIEWIEDGYGSGDVVRYGHTIGILSTSTPSYSEFCAYLSYEGKLIVSELGISTDRIIAPSESDRKEIFGKLRLAGLDFDERLGRVCQRKLPPKYTRISYRYGGVIGHGIIDSIDKDEVHFLFGIEKNRVRQDFHAPLLELSTSPADKYGLKVIADTLSDASLKWNPSTRKLEKLHPRVKMGETYWHISDKFTVSSAIENYAPTSNARHDRGNYFTSHSEAVEFLNTVMELRRREIK